jgi:epoxyqueuosine reductase
VHASSSPTALGLSPALDAAGVNLAGVLAIDDYDARVPESWQSGELLPGARSAFVLATGGDDFYGAFAESPEAADVEASDPLDRFLRRVVRGAAEAEGGAPGFYFERRGGRFADFIGLARAAGLGAPSRLAILIHPTFGPWLAIRAVMLSKRRVEPTPLDPAFAPCSGCPAPCESACLGRAIPSTGFELERCVETSREEARCRVGCAARRACVVGPEHRYGAEAEASYRRAALGDITVRGTAQTID